jgi:toxin ParE1/3/4
MRILLTDRAQADLVAIRRDSIEQWGKKVARKYMGDLNAALARLEAAPGILQQRPERSLRLHFYPAREHVLVCDATDAWICVLAVWHGRMDLPARLEELEPQLVKEAELLIRKVKPRQN